MTNVNHLTPVVIKATFFPGSHRMFFVLLLLINLQLILFVSFLIFLLSELTFVSLSCCPRPLESVYLWINAR